MKVLKYPVIAITLFFALGISAASYFAPSSLIAATATAIGLIFFLVCYHKAVKDLIQKPYFAISALLLAFCIGILAQTFNYKPNSKLHYTHIIDSGDTPVIRGFISERLKPDKYREKYYLEIESINRQPATGKLLVLVPKDSLNTVLGTGDAFIIADELHPIAKPMNPYRFDYAAYMAKQGVFHQLWLRDNFIRAGTVKNFSYYVGQYRDKLMSSFDRHHFNPQVQHTLNALLFGQRQDINTATADAYKNAGVMHILAISGLHFAVLFYMLSFVLRPIGRFSRNGRLFQFITILALLWSFAFITGLSASVVRSVVMFTFISIGTYFNRNGNIYNSLAVSALVLLMCKPAFLFDAGFQLSYLAVISIVALEPFYKRVRTKYKAVNYVTDVLLVSLAAQVGVLPLSLYYFNQFPLLFLLANLVVIPLSNIVLVSGIIILLLNFFWGDAAIVVGKALEMIVESMNGFISWIASFDGLVLKNIPFTLVLNLALYVVIFTGILWLYRKSYRRTIAFLCTALLFQGIYAVTAIESRVQEEMVVFHNTKNSLIALKNKHSITAYSTDSLALEGADIRAYNKANFNQPLNLKSVQNMLWSGQQKVLVIDNNALYTPNMRPDILILARSPKLNLERVIAELAPKQVVADGTNNKYHVSLWAATCQKQKIPFHATAEKGFYSIR